MKSCFAQSHRELCAVLAPFETHNILFSFHRKLFFTDYGNVAKVERCDMDGMNRTWIVDSKIEQPTALALDLINKYVYWVDIYLDNVEVVDYEGRKRHTVIKGRQVGIYLKNVGKCNNINIQTCIMSINFKRSTACFVLFAV